MMVCEEGEEVVGYSFLTKLAPFWLREVNQ